MEAEIFNLIKEAGAYALIIAILFYYALWSFRSFRDEKKQLRNDLAALQKEFHEFKNQMIEKLISLSNETKSSIDNLTDAVNKKTKTYS